MGEVLLQFVVNRADDSRIPGLLNRDKPEGACQQCFYPRNVPDIQVGGSCFLYPAWNKKYTTLSLN